MIGNIVFHILILDEAGTTVTLPMRTDKSVETL